MSGQVIAVLFLTLLHAGGMVILFALMGREFLDVFRSKPSDDGGGGEPPAADPSVKPSPGGGGLPLPDADQAPARLREPGRLGDRYGRPARRPDHEPNRTPERV